MAKTQDVLDKIPEHVRAKIERLRKAYKNGYPNWETAMANSSSYCEGLRDSGLITDRERMILFIYTTV